MNIRLDNTGESRIIQPKADQENLRIKFEFTAPGTPKQNSVVEGKVPMIMGRGSAMINHVRELDLAMCFPIFEW